MENNPEEIHLIDFLRLIIKRKNVIISIVLITTLVSAVIFLWRENSYKVQTIIQIGKISSNGSSELIESPTILVQKIKLKTYNELVGKKLSIPKDSFPKITAENPRDTSLIVLTTQVKNKEFGKKVLEEIITTITQEYEKIFQSNIRSIQTAIKTEKDTALRINNNITNLKKTLSTDNTKTLTGLTMLSIYENELTKIKANLINLEKIQNTSSKTSVIKDISATSNLKASLLLLYIFLGLLIGTFGGVCYLACLEWWKKSKDEF